MQHCRWPSFRWLATTRGNRAHQPAHLSRYINNSCRWEISMNFHKIAVAVNPYTKCGVHAAESAKSGYLRIYVALVTHMGGCTMALFYLPGPQSNARTRDHKAILHIQGYWDTLSRIMNEAILLLQAPCHFVVAKLQCYLKSSPDISPCHLDRLSIFLACFSMWFRHDF